MSTTELKNILIERINEIEDPEFLSAIKTILDAKTSELFPLSKEQKKRIEEGRRQIEDGKYITNDEVLTELKKWIKNR